MKFDLRFMTQWNSSRAIQNNDNDFFFPLLYAIIFVSRIHIPSQTRIAQLLIAPHGFAPSYDAFTDFT